MTDQLTLPTRCPRCGTGLVSEYGAVPWCGACEWNLGTFDDQKGVFRWRWLDRLERGTAYRLSKRQYADLVGRPVGRGGGGPVRALFIALAIVLLTGQLALLAVGVYLIAYRFPSLFIVPGVILILLMLALRPRIARFDQDAVVLTRDEAPTLFRLIDETAAAIGSPLPAIVAVDADVNAYTRMVGVRHRRVLCLGLPLWAVLGPQERVALLGHELGHFINGDVRRGVITSIPDHTLAGLIDALSPGWALSARRSESLFFEALAGVVLAVLRSMVRLVRVLLLIVLLRNWQRAEYLADQMAARAGGTGAAAALTDHFLAAEVIWMLACRESRAGGLADRWRAAVAEAAAERAARLRRLRQLSAREEASLFASHPPSGLRASMLASRQPESARVALSVADPARIDEELAAHYQRVRRELVHA